MERIFYRINEPHVISELIDGEVIILNFESGTYYSLNESGMVLWHMIRKGCCRNEMLAQIDALYMGNLAITEIDLDEILKQLENESLVVPTDSIVVSSNADIKPPVGTYEKPSLEKFTDLQDLLLLDPIHDVDAMGWPNQTQLTV